METLETLLEEKRLPEIAKIGHRMKGHGVSYGFEALSLIGKRIETAAKQNDLAQTELLLENLSVLVKEISDLEGVDK